MALFRNSTSATGTAARDFFFGVTGGPNHVFDGGDGSDFLLGDAVDILVDTTTANSAARVTDLTTLSAAFTAATNIDLAAFWTSQTNPTVDDDSVPHMSIYGTGTSTNNSEFFTVTVGAGETITLDTDFARLDFDPQVRLFDMNSSTPVASNDDSPIDPGDISSFESFLTYTNNTSAVVTYLVEVEARGAGQIATTDQYILNVSVTNHATGAGTIVAGNDRLDGGNGNDVLFGVDGNDTFIGSDNDGDDYIDGGDGIDRLNYASVTTDLTINLGITTAQDTGGAGIDTFLNIERVDGGSGNNTLTAADTNSDLRGGSGNDTLTGGSGDDFLVGGTGQDIIIAGGGDDTVQFDRTNQYQAGEALDGGSGTDRIILANSIDNTVFDFRTATTFANFEEIYFAQIGGEEIVVQLTQTQWDANSFTDIISEPQPAEAVIEVFADSTDTLDLSGLTFDSDWDETLDQVILQGDAQNNTLIAANVASIITGGDGDDTISGGAGDDTLDGGAGTNDTLSYADYAPAPSGAGLVISLAGTTVTTVTAGTDTISGFENVTGSAFNDTIFGNFNTDNVIEGGDGSDAIFGNGGADVIEGGDGNDFIFVTALDSETDIGSVFDGGDGTTDALVLERFADGVSDTANFRDDEILNIETFIFEDGTEASLSGQFNADQFIFETVIANSHAGQTRNVEIFLDAETTLDLSGITFTGFTEMGDGISIFGSNAGLADTIIGSSIDDTINAGGGDDVIIGGAGADTIDGGTGVNTLSYAGSSVGVQINLSINQFNNGDAAGDSATNIQNLTGSDGDDNLVGTSDANILVGGAGNDRIHALGGTGVDQVFGGTGDDDIRIDFGELLDGETYDGGGNTDTLRLIANGGGDTFDFTNVTVTDFEILNIRQILAGGHDLTFNSDQFEFNAVNITASDGSDVSITVNLGSDNFINLNDVTFDTNWTAGSTFTINGDEGNDEITGTSQQDMLNGGIGNDILRLRFDSEGFETDTYNGGDDSFDGTSNSGDILGIQGRSSGVDTTFDLTDATILDIEELEFFSAGLQGGVTQIILSASQISESGLALDAVIDGENPEYLDSIAIEMSAETSLNLSEWTFRDWQAGEDTIVISGDDDAEDITGTSQNDEINGGGGDDNLRGSSGEDDLDGGAGSDRLEGGTFSDTLFGGTGEDTLIGGSGNDFIDGWTGFDTALYTGLSTGVTVDLEIETAQDTIGAGTDTLIRVENLIGSGQADTLSGNFNRNRLDGGAGDDVLDGRGGNDTLLGGTGDDALTGGTGADRLVGGAGEDELFGGNQRDRLEGGADDDTLFGGSDVDRLLGGEGDDTLVGGTGTDFLFGGSGADSFVFTGESDSGVGPFQRDEIRDFNSSDGDQIVLQNFDADSTTAGFQLFSDGGDSFSGTAGEIIIQSFVRSGVDVRIISLDTDGDAKADSQIYLISDDVQFSDITQLFGAVTKPQQSNEAEFEATEDELAVFDAPQTDLSILATIPLYDISDFEPGGFDMGTGFYEMAESTFNDLIAL